MIQLASPHVVHDLLNRHHIAPNKRFGQNFLIDQGILQKIADAAHSNRRPVLEIGPGLGSLTQHLAQRAENVLAVEIDKGFLPVLRETLADFSNVDIIHADFLKMDLSSLYEALGKKPFCVCANLPYYITTPIILRLLESHLPWETLCFLMQKEVGERLSATPNHKSYGSLSLAIQYYAHVETIGKVGARCFLPPPNVDSIIVRLRPKERSLNLQEEKRVFAIIRASFAMRRKTFVNNITAAFPSFSKESVQTVLEVCGFDVRIRAEALSFHDFVLLVRALFQNLQDI